MDVFGVLAGGGIAIATGLVNRIWGRTDKREERVAGRDDKQRDDLRSAYAAFIGAYTRFLDKGQMLLIATRMIRDAPMEHVEHAVMNGIQDPNELARIHANAVPEALRTRGQRAADDFVEAASEADIRAVGATIIDDDAERCARTLALAKIALVAPQNSEDEEYERFQAEINALRAQLDQLRDSLISAFSPDVWHAALAEQRELKGKMMPQITDGKTSKP